MAGAADQRGLAHHHACHHHRHPPGHAHGLDTGEFWVFDNLLVDHVGLPQVVIFAVHLVIFCAGWVKGIILRHSYQRHFIVRALLPSKVRGWVGGGGL